MIEVVPFVHEGLGNSSYLLDVGRGSAVLVDPDRSADRYVREAERRDLRIVAVLETHVHADFVIGALEIRAATGATLYHAAEGGPAYEHRGLRGGDRLRLGDVDVEVRASPGHTPEHLSFVVRGSDGAAPPLAFTGGALIVGGAARTDLIAPELTDPLTRALFQLGRHALDDLPDETVVLPTHGGGSFCSAGTGRSRTSTLGEERSSNPVLTFPGGEHAFVRWFPSTFASTPDYYAWLRGRNAAGPRLVAEIGRPRAMTARDFAAGSAGAGVTLDARAPDAYAEGHVPGSLAIPFRDSFAVWLGWLVSPDATIALVLDDDSILDDVLAEAYLVGIERFVVVLDGGLDAWSDAGLPLKTTDLLEPADVVRRMQRGTTFIDVREPDEFTSGHASDASSIPLGSLRRKAGELPKGAPIIVTCGVGERAISAVSILEREGFVDVASLDGGMDAWGGSGLPLVAGSAQT